MAAGRLRRCLLLLAVSLLPVGLAACGGEDNPALGEERGRAFERLGDERRSGIREAVRRGELPPVALDLIGPGGSVNPNFVDGPNLDEDIVRTRDGGESGPTLQFDLDQNGRIDPDEREITERELYDGTLGLR